MGCMVSFGSLDYMETLSQESRIPEQEITNKMSTSSPNAVF